MPVGPFKTFDECVNAQKEKGQDEESARKICGEIEKRSIEKGVPHAKFTASWKPGGVFVVRR